MFVDVLGKTTDAEVLRAEPYGVYLQSPIGEIIVLIPDVSYERIPDLTARYRVGDRVRVKVLAYVADRELFKGSIREADAQA